MNKKVINIFFYIFVIMFILLFVISTCVIAFGNTAVYTSYRKNSNISKIQEMIDAQYGLRNNYGSINAGYSMYFGHDNNGVYIYKVSLNQESSTPVEKYVAYDSVEKKFLGEADSLEEIWQKVRYNGNYILIVTNVS